MATATDTADGATGIPDLVLDPFAFIPDLSSVIHGLHGDDPTDPNYVFHTPYVDNLTGIVTMEVTFTDLRSRKDRMVLNVHALDRATDRLELAKTADVSLRTVAASGGQTSISFEAEAGRAYALLGRTTAQPQASASSLTILCRQRPKGAQVAEAPAPLDSGFHPDTVRAVAALAGSYRPMLANPMSQACTDSQLREAAFRDWSNAGKFPKPATAAQWEIAYLMQVLKMFGVLDARGHGLGFGAMRPDLLALLHRAGCTTDSAPPPSHRGADGTADGGAQDGYFSLVALPDPALLGTFDFLWSTGLCDILRSTEDIIHLAEDSIGYLKPGGLAVHLLSADLRPDETGMRRSSIFTRNSLGQFSLAMVAAKNEAAQLNLYADRQDGQPAPYGIILRKG